ncbi:MAG: hypothetical protein E6F98_07970 [Actinobacteria bacterium]|nr:MAG: hypothetical protein E6F98_07970 [Actinomycetota bacterium]
MDARVTVGAALLAASLAGFSTAILIVLASLAAIAGSVPDRVGIAILISAVLTLVLVGLALSIGIAAMRKAGAVPRDIRMLGAMALLVSLIAVGAVVISSRTSNPGAVVAADMLVLFAVIVLFGLAFAVLRRTPTPPRRPKRSHYW